jgi:hypothetical protein
VDDRNKPKTAWVRQDVRRNVLTWSAGRPASFDRIGFAMRALAILKPRDLTVAVYEGRHEVEVERGRQWGRGRGKEWAMVSIPAHASRESIAVALAQLAGVADEPYVIETLLLADAGVQG